MFEDRLPTASAHQMQFPLLIYVPSFSMEIALSLLGITFGVRHPCLEAFVTRVAITSQSLPSSRLPTAACSLFRYLLIFPKLDSIIAQPPKLLTEINIRSQVPIRNNFLFFEKFMIPEKTAKSRIRPTVIASWWSSRLLRN